MTNLKINSYLRNHISKTITHSFNLFICAIKMVQLNRLVIDFMYQFQSQKGLIFEYIVLLYMYFVTHLNKKRETSLAMIYDEAKTSLVA